MQVPKIKVFGSKYCLWHITKLPLLIMWGRKHVNITDLFECELCLNIPIRKNFKNWIVNKWHSLQDLVFVQQTFPTNHKDQKKKKSSKHNFHCTVNNCSQLTAAFVYHFYFLVCRKYHTVNMMLRSNRKLSINLSLGYFTGRVDCMYNENTFGTGRNGMNICPLSSWIVKFCAELNPKNHSKFYELNKILLCTICMYVGSLKSAVLYNNRYPSYHRFIIYENVPPFASTINLNEHLELIFEATSMRLIFIYFHEMEIRSSITLNHQWKL